MSDITDHGYVDPGIIGELRRAREQAEIYRQETHRWKESLAKAEADRDQAISACAVMRELLATASKRSDNPMAWPFAIWSEFVAKSKAIVATASPGQPLLDRLAALEQELVELRKERSDLHHWFEHHHVTGTFTLEEIDVMTPSQMADHCYERMADKFYALEDKIAHQRMTAEQIKPQ